MKAALLSVFFCVLPALLFAEKVALVIGNADYEHVTPLNNPGYDARAVTAALTRQGFEVVKATDLTRSALYNTLRDFRDKADRADVAMVYYAGHGIEIGGQNYLIPVDARLSDERDAAIEMIGMDAVLQQLSGARKLKMVVLDACRDNPFIRKMQRENRGRNVGRGLAIVSNAESATLIAYAAAAGEVTPDGPGGQNSPFTAASLRALDQPPPDVRIIVGAVRDELGRTVPGAVPFVYSSLGAEQVVINPNSARPAPPDPRPTAEPEQTALDEDAMLRDFAKAEFAGTVAAWEGFLERYAEFSTHMLYVLAQRSQKQVENQILAAVPEQPPVVGEATDAPQVEPAPAQVASVVQPPEAPRQQPVRGIRELKVALQSALKARGCYRSSIDGIWGRGSAAAVDRFNAATGAELRIRTDSSNRDFEAAIARVEGAGDVICMRQPVKEARQTTSAAPSAPAAPVQPSTPVENAGVNPTVFPYFCIKKYSGMGNSYQSQRCVAYRRTQTSNQPDAGADTTQNAATVKRSPPRTEAEVRKRAEELFGEGSNSVKWCLEYFRQGGSAKYKSNCGSIYQ